MNLKDIPIADLLYIIPSDIKIIVGTAFAFLCVLAIWRIIK